MIAAKPGDLVMIRAAPHVTSLMLRSVPWKPGAVDTIDEVSGVVKPLSIGLVVSTPRSAKGEFMEAFVLFSGPVMGWIFFSCLEMVHAGK